MAVPRVTARVLPVDDRGAVLLLLDQDPARPGELRWASIGGAVDPGESVAQAAVRELFEETGIVAAVDDLTAPVARVARAYSYDGVDYDGDHTYLALHLPGAVEVSFDHLEAEEVGNVLDSEWWTPQALVADGRMVEPDLPDLIERAVAAVGGDA